MNHQDEFESLLHVHEDGRYLMKGNQPFFWLADTAWLMLRNLNLDETSLFMRNRKEKGYNVLQVILIWDIPKDLQGKDLEMKDLTREGYWAYVDQVLDMAADMGLYMALLPAWGSIVKDGIMTMENVEAYSHFLGERYKKYKNIIWMIGGDVRGDENYDVFNKEATILKTYNPDRLMTFHPFGRTASSRWFHNESWLDFNTFQSGHRRYDQLQLGQWDDNLAVENFYGQDNWQYVLDDYALENPKPTFDAEPSYEGIPQGLHNPREPFWEEWDVRRYAYWSVFAGSTGHTYGSNAIMQFYCDDSVPGDFSVRETWKDAIHHPGGSQMQYLKELMLSVDWIKGQAADGLLLYGQKERYHRISVFAGDDYVLCYTYMGDVFMLDLSPYRDITLEAYWMNPSDGTYSYIDTYTNISEQKFSPVRRKGIGNDWVLVLRKER